MECITRTELEIMNKFRSLWEQHSEWTRMAITAIVFDTPDKPYTINRLLRNPRDFAMTLRIFYGMRIADEFSDLLTEHLTIAAQLVEAIIAGDAERVEELNTLWYRNAEDIAKFLARINPCWSQREWKAMLFMHLDFVAEEATTMINGQYQRSIDVYDVAEKQALEMADEMSRGIIKQFTKKNGRKR